MNVNQDPPAEDGEQPPTISFDYIKTNDFRTVYADGIFGGLTPRGKVHISFWSERQPIPQKIVHQITSDGLVGNEILRVERASLVRNVEVGVLMDLETAKAFIGWLQEKVEVAENLSKDQNMDIKSS